MLDKIKTLLNELAETSIVGKEQIEELRIRYISKKGILNQLFTEFKDLAPEKRKEVGKALNELKIAAQGKINHFKDLFDSENTESSSTDTTAPGESIALGTRHPLAIVRNRIIDIFGRMGFTVAEGPEIEDDWHVFSALNFAPEHPARDMQDTFFIEKDPDILLRTHTSSVQIRMMEKTQPPIRAIFPGRVFRNEVVSARSHCIFHQVEGLYVDENVSFADLRQTLLYFAKELFGEGSQIRLRPSYFPFTEPSAEMDVSCSICGGKGCNVCKYSGWLEILGCGMVDPNVLEACKIDNEKYTGFAFGMGIERIAMLLYGVKDIRLYFENDVRFLKQFQSAL
ncbi:MAG: phenylalanine--tRNA ligase subunit alpha [Prolixibacteraceae bacterium]|nr:phenylalanine--tRNA ligase subunit alpha [Prolixibacteraceae bacterium]